MSERDRNTDWMDGRMVFLSPESLGSNVLRRCIVGSQAEHDRMSAVQAQVIDERLAMSDADIAAEIVDYAEYLRQARLGLA
jgi:hypothetical protein